MLEWGVEMGCWNGVLSYGLKKVVERKRGGLRGDVGRDGWFRGSIQRSAVVKLA